MKKNIFFVLSFLIFFSSVVHAEFLGDVESLKRYNPDGKKYEFVKTYITSLSYLKKIDERQGDDISLDSEPEDVYEDIVELKGNLIQDNASLRVARNLMRNYQADENGLMLKVVDLFTQACDQKVASNQEMRKNLEGYIQAYTRGSLKDFDNKSFVMSLQKTAKQDKDSSLLVLEAAMLTSKVLISPNTNYYGEIDKLGITEEERRKLLRRLDDFYGESYSGRVRDGQTSLQASIAALKEILEDYNWDTLDS